MRDKGANWRNQRVKFSTYKRRGELLRGENLWRRVGGHQPKGVLKEGVVLEERGQQGHGEALLTESSNPLLGLPPYPSVKPTSFTCEWLTLLTYQEP